MIKICPSCGNSGWIEVYYHHPSCKGGDDLTTCLSLCPILEPEECPDCAPKYECIDTFMEEDNLESRCDSS